jgi:hypothetical protein
MPSRRTVLGALGTAVALPLAGCMSSPQRVDGYVQKKVVTGVTEDGTYREETDIIKVSTSFDPNGEGPSLNHLNEEWAGRFPVPLMPVVSDALHEEFTDLFDRIRYVVGVTSPEWAEQGESLGSYNVATTRENFNRVQVDNHVTASSDGTSLTIYSVSGLWEFSQNES